jgi:hypothetical protein
MFGHDPATRPSDAEATKPQESTSPQLVDDILDASADPSINTRIWGRIVTYDIPARRNAKIFQVRRKGFSRQSITGVNAFGQEFRPAEAQALRGEILAFISRVLSTHTRVLVVAQRRVAEMLRPCLESEIRSGRIALTHFQALRGLNTFEDCDAAIIIGREQPSPGAVEAYARAIFWDHPDPLRLSGEFIWVPTTRRLMDGRLETESMQQHPDRRVNAFLRQIRERELEQAQDRLRLIHNAMPKTVYLLTNIPIDSDITDSATWSLFTHTEENRIGQAIVQSIRKCGTISVPGSSGLAHESGRHSGRPCTSLLSQ